VSVIGRVWKLWIRIEFVRDIVRDVTRQTHLTHASDAYLGAQRFHKLTATEILGISTVISILHCIDTICCKLRDNVYLLYY